MSQFESTTDQLMVSLQDRVAVLTMNRPEARNALSPDLSRELCRAIAWSSESPDVGALLLTGAGSAFCSGGDVKAMGKSKKPDKPGPTTEQQFQELRNRHQNLGGALRAMRKPTLAALPGAAAGAGMAIALACDIRIAADNAFLTTAYARIGLSGDYGIAWLLSRVVGPGRARQLMLTAERVEARQAYDIGLVNQVSTPENLQTEAFTLAQRLANGPLTDLCVYERQPRRGT